MSITLEIVGGSRDGEVLTLPDSGGTVGRAADSRLQFAHDENISRQHARLLREGGDVFIEDLSSTHGTFVGAVRVNPGVRRAVLPRQPIRVGNSWFVVVQAEQ